MQEAEFKQKNWQEAEPGIYETVFINGQFIAERRLSGNHSKSPHSPHLDVYDRRQSDNNDSHLVDLYI